MTQIHRAHIAQKATTMTIPTHELLDLETRGELDRAPALRALLAQRQQDARAEQEHARILAARAARAAAPTTVLLPQSPSSDDDVFIYSRQGADVLVAEVNVDGRPTRLCLSGAHGFATPEQAALIKAAFAAGPRYQAEAFVFATGPFDSLSDLLERALPRQPIDSPFASVCEGNRDRSLISRWYDSELTSDARRAGTIRRFAAKFNFDPAEGQPGAHPMGVSP